MTGNLCNRGIRAIARVVSAAALAILAACGGGGESGSVDATTALAASMALSSASAPGAFSAPARGPALAGEQPRQVNTTTAGKQLVRAIGALADGGYAVAWLSESASGTAALPEMYVRRFDAMGTPEGDETLVSFDLDIDANPAIAVFPDGSVVIAYSAKRIGQSVPGSRLESSSIYTQRFDPAGAPVGGETVVFSLVRDLASAREVDSAINPAIILWQDGSYMVGWELQHDRGVLGTFSDFNAQRYDAAGAPLGAVSVFSGRGDPTATFELLAIDNGGYVVSSTYSFQGSPYAVFEVLDSAGRRVGTIGPLYDSDYGLPAGETVLLPLSHGGGFVLWSRNKDGTYVQRLDSSGSAAGALVPSAPPPLAAYALSDGGYVALWQSPASSFTTAQRYESRGSAVGEAFQVAAAGVAPLAAVLADAALAFAWSAPTLQGDLDVFTQLFHAPDLPGKAPRQQRHACLAQAKAQGLAGHERRQFMAACMSSFRS